MRRLDLVLVLAIAFIACGGEGQKPAAPAVTASARPIALEVAKDAEPAPLKLKKLASSLFVGKSRTWVVLASGRVAVWGDLEESDAQYKPVFAARPILDKARKDVMGLVPMTREWRSPEVEPTFITSGNESLPTPASEANSRLPGARLIDFDKASGCGVMPDGTIRCVGPIANEWTNDVPENDGSAGPRDFGKYPDIVELSVGELHACALRKNGEVMCWGHVGPGLLGNGESFVRERAAVGGIADAKAVQLNYDSDGGCAIRRDGRVACWGSNRRGQLGTKSPAGSVIAIDIPGVEKAERFVADAHCVLRSDARVQCWGLFGSGGDQLKRADPSPWIAPTTDALDAAVLYERGLCIVKKGGTVECHGKAKSTLPRSTGAIGIAVGHGDAAVLTCVLLAGGLARCWADEQEEAITFRVPKDAVEIDALGSSHWHGAHGASLSVRAASGAFGTMPLGMPIDRERKKPTPKGLVPSGALEVTRKDVAKIVRGTMGFFLVTKDGHLLHGDEVQPDLSDVVDGANADPANAYDTTCVVQRDGSVLCWGAEMGAGLGRGSTAYAKVPVHVPLPEPPLL